MALALNNFKTVATTVSASPTINYTSPVGYSGVVLLAQVTNVGIDTETLSVWHRRSIGAIVDIQMLKEYPIPSGETLNLFTGKLILESGNSLVVQGTNGSNLNLIISILETLN
jgi:hypothetical protein